MLVGAWGLRGHSCGACMERSRVDAAAALSQGPKVMAALMVSDVGASCARVCVRFGLWAVLMSSADPRRCGGGVQACLKGGMRGRPSHLLVGKGVQQTTRG